MPAQWVAFAITLGGAVGLVKSTEQLARFKLLASRNVRKVMHICTGLVYMVTWVNYGPQKSSKWLAASVPALMTLRFAAVGLGILKDPQLIASATRRGGPSELLHGPLMYGVIHALCTVLWWRESPAAIVGLAALCAGDGLAEVAGRAAGKDAAKLPHNKSKTWVGSLACAVASFAASLPFVMLFNKRGFLDQRLTTSAMMRGCGVCGVVAAAVESLPLTEVDNVTVPLITGLVAAYGRVFR